MRDRLRCYASQLQFGWGETKKAATSLEDYAHYAEKAVADGYDAIKIDFFTFALDGHRYTSEDTSKYLSGENLKIVMDRVKTVRAAVGPDVDIIMENHSNLNAQSAIQLGNLVKEYNIFF